MTVHSLVPNHQVFRGNLLQLSLQVCRHRMLAHHRLAASLYMKQTPAAAISSHTPRISLHHSCSSQRTMSFQQLPPLTVPCMPTNRMACKLCLLGLLSTQRRRAICHRRYTGHLIACSKQPIPDLSSCFILQHPYLACRLHSYSQHLCNPCIVCQHSMLSLKPICHQATHILHRNVSLQGVIMGLFLTLTLQVEVQTFTETGATVSSPSGNQGIIQLKVSDPPGFLLCKFAIWFS